MIHSIIVEDDPMVAQINRQYLQAIGDFSVDAVFANGRDALGYLRTRPTDLMILDVYMPGISGSELLRQMRGENIKCDVIMITAATERCVVDEALRLGVVDYLIKSLTFPRIQEDIQKYLCKMDLLKSSDTVDQSMVDRLLRNEPSPSVDHGDLRKGLNPKTLRHIYDYLKEHAGESHTCESISSSAGLSKVTIRRYLNYLIETGQVLSFIDYETGGRPRILYRLK